MRGATIAGVGGDLPARLRAIAVEPESGLRFAPPAEVRDGRLDEVLVEVKRAGVMRMRLSEETLCRPN
ncbi:hypothetical protein [Sphingomonas jatrophae]|uniref:hypothetical protein n=1 Tax=Sphingomonas jatrophae TaxID=1166337 RepID=UPI001042031B|nr:hypothetical protein [Sphingomonas jatrophae]